MRVLGIIPARLASTRLPNKPLQLLAGEPLITRVIQRVVAHGILQDLVVATDSQDIARVVDRAGIRSILTHDGHLSGTDRVAEAAGRPEFAGFDAVANVQGDEPFVSREALAGAIERIGQGDDIGTAAAPLAAEDAPDPARVKVVTDARGRALYFSRAVIPHRREATDPATDLYWQHVGLYVYTRAALATWVGAQPSAAEQAERLEQLRALHCGLTIGVARLSEAALPGVDTPDDLRRAEAHWHALQR
ncbi:MAG: 3-deoxy-manno-octulosonate cytidylyltransferase [Gemmatimonadota bacterium]|nr:3-deoxy-manno-octulosonate cytidylyltransferase [Gemmatimonadales bacterium]MDQ3137995.1 3-deoxy-manno-octulosonate cytidylyltransferase [Gemmatimonadota bacterium]